MRNPASTSCLASAGAISGKSISRSLTWLGSTPDFCSEAFTTTSAMLFSVLTATVLPASCLTSRIVLPFGTMSAPKSFWPAPWADVPGAIASTGRPFEAAINSETTFEPATWILPLTSDGTAVAPPCEDWRLIFSLCLVKKPFAWPKATNAEGTPAVSCTFSVVSPPASELTLGAPPPPPPHAAIASAPMTAPVVICMERRMSASSAACPPFCPRPADLTPCRAVTSDLPSLADYPHRQAIPTRWKDNDVYGHVNNVEYYSFFDTIINEFLIRRRGLDILRGPVIGLCAESHCAFTAALVFPEPVEAGLRVGHLGTSSVRYEIGLFAEGAQAASGWFVHVFVYRQTRRPAPIPDPIRAALATLEV